METFGAMSLYPQKEEKEWDAKWRITETHRIQTILAWSSNIKMLPLLLLSQIHTDNCHWMPINCENFIINIPPVNEVDNISCKMVDFSQGTQ